MGREVRATKGRPEEARTDEPTPARLHIQSCRSVGDKMVVGRVRLSFPPSTTTKFRAELPFGVMVAVPVQSVATE